MHRVDPRSSSMGKVGRLFVTPHLNVAVVLRFWSSSIVMIVVRLSGGLFQHTEQGHISTLSSTGNKTTPIASFVGQRLHGKYRWYGRAILARSSRFCLVRGWPNVFFKKTAINSMSGFLDLYPDDSRGRYRLQRRRRRLSECSIKMSMLFGGAIQRMYWLAEAVSIVNSCAMGTGIAISNRLSKVTLVLHWDLKTALLLR